MPYTWNYIICGICVWLLSPSIMFLTFIHVVACVKYFSFFIVECFLACVCQILFIHLLMIIWVISTLGLLWKKVPMNIVYKSWLGYMFISFGKKPRSGIAKSYNQMLSLFHFLWHAICFTGRIVYCFFFLILKHLEFHGWMDIDKSFVESVSFCPIVCSALNCLYVLRTGRICRQNILSGPSFTPAHEIFRSVL